MNCPFCNHTDTYQCDFSTYCKNCGANASTRLWNNRTTDTTKLEADLKMCRKQLADVRSIVDLSFMEQCIKHG